jgi:hypothetical protein
VAWHRWQQRLGGALVPLRGALPVPGHRSTRYVALKRKDGGFYYVGKAGALRIGDTVATSRPLADVAKRRLLAEAERTAG